MEGELINGGYPLLGEVAISGAKNSVLPMLAATLLTQDTMVLHHAPQLNDVRILQELLSRLGVAVVREGHTLTVKAHELCSLEAPEDLVRQMRASILVLGPLLARFGEAVVAMPGGCSIGARPIEQHLAGLRAMGALIQEDGPCLRAQAPRGLKACDFRFGVKTVGGTENVLMAACLAEGTSRLRNASREPEVLDLIALLQSMGASIAWEKADVLLVTGVAQLHGTTHTVLPDRLETGTFLTAAAMTQGHVVLTHTRPHLLEAVLVALEQAGALVIRGDTWIGLDMRQRTLKAINLITGPYPGFPTDMQAQMMALNSMAAGYGRITETVFENRFQHMHELNLMGAQLQLEGQSVLSLGQPLKGARVTATDLRAAAALVLAGLAAEGTTEIDAIQHIDRGYEDIEEKLTHLGAHIKRVRTTTKVSV